MHAGGQAIVGAVTPGDGSSRQSEEQTRATREITHEPGIPMRSPDPQWEPVPIADNAPKRRGGMHGGAPGSGAPIGNKNALRHGHYTAEVIARRRGLAELITMARATLADLEKRA